MALFPYYSPIIGPGLSRTTQPCPVVTYLLSIVVAQVHIDMMFRVIGHSPHDLHWDFLGNEFDEDGVTIKVHFGWDEGPSSRRIHLEKATSFMRTHAGFDWLSILQSKWIVDLDSLTRRFPGLATLGWLTGKVTVEPDIEREEKVIPVFNTSSGRSERRYVTLSFVLVITRDIMGEELMAPSPSKQVSPDSSPDANKSGGLTLFYSYSHADEKYRKKLEAHLSLLKHERLIADWHDRRIPAGSEWMRQIDEYLNTSDIILLLISSDFLSSNFCYDIELKRAIERHEAGKARVIPVIVKPCDWQPAPFGKLQALPRDGKPIIKWKPQDDAYSDIARGLRHVVKELRPSLPSGHANAATTLQSLLSIEVHSFSYFDATPLPNDPFFIVSSSLRNYHCDLTITNTSSSNVFIRKIFVVIGGKRYESSPGEKVIRLEPGQYRRLDETFSVTEQSPMQSGDFTLSVLPSIGDSISFRGRFPVNAS